MEFTEKGWIVLSENHPNSNETFIDNTSFDIYKRDSIRKFLHESGADWKYWRTKFNFKCVKCTQTIKID